MSDTNNKTVTVSAEAYVQLVAFAGMAYTLLTKAAPVLDSVPTLRVPINRALTMPGAIQAAEAQKQLSATLEALNDKAMADSQLVVGPDGEKPASFAGGIIVPASAPRIVKYG